MKTYKRISLILIFCSFSVFVFSQKMCQVLMPEIDGKYIGKCKNGMAHGKGKAIGTDTYEGKFRKGLPHGRGTYTWASGGIYIGEWEHGKKHGEGKLTVVLNGKELMKEGIWELDKYIGPKPQKPSVKKKEGVERYNFSRLGDGNRVSVDIRQGGVRNTKIEEFTIFGDSGTLIKTGHTTGYDNIKFPFIGKVRYKAWNKLQTSQFYVIFEFEIKDAGDWEVVIHN